MGTVVFNFQWAYHQLILAIFQNSVLTSQRTNSAFITKTNESRLFREIIFVYAEKHKKPSTDICAKCSRSITATGIRAKDMQAYQ
jgi:hypothetical protein